MASLLLPFVPVGAVGVACFECINVGVGDAILTAFIFLGVAGGEAGTPLTRPRLLLVPRSVRGGGPGGGVRPKEYPIR